MSKGSKWRKTDFGKYRDNWPLGGPKRECAEKPKLTAEEAAAKILETVKKRPGLLIV